MREKPALPRLILPLTLRHAEDTSEPVRVHADRGQNRDVLERAAPAALEHEAIEVDLAVRPFDRLGAPAIDLPIPVGLSLETRARSHPNAPQRFGDLLHSAH